MLLIETELARPDGSSSRAVYDADTGITYVDAPGLNDTLNRTVVVIPGNGELTIAFAEQFDVFISKLVAENNSEEGEDTRQ